MRKTLKKLEYIYINYNKRIVFKGIIMEEEIKNVLANIVICIEQINDAQERLNILEEKLKKMEEKLDE